MDTINAGTVYGKVNAFMGLAEKLGWEKYEDTYTKEDKVPSKAQKDTVTAQATTAYIEATNALAQFAEQSGVK